MPLNITQVAPSPDLAHVIPEFFTIEYNDNIVRKEYVAPAGLPCFFYLETMGELEMKFTISEDRFLMKNGLYLNYINQFVEHSHQKMKIIGLFIHPIYLSLVFGKEPSAILNTCTRLDSFDLEKAKELESLMSGKAMDEIIQSLEKYIFGQLKKNPVRKDVERIYRELIVPGEFQMKIDKLAESLGYTERHITELFKKHIGLSPKKFLQLIRLTETMKKLSTTKEKKNLTKIAHDLGYYDQAHFIKDFKAICGQTPSYIMDQDESISDIMRRNLILK